MPSPSPGRTFRVARPDGAELHVEIEGTGRSALVLCDGLACDGFAWKYLLPAVAEHHRVVHWHYRGHGQSPLPPPGLAPPSPSSRSDLAAGARRGAGEERRGRRSQHGRAARARVPPPPPGPSPRAGARLRQPGPSAGYLPRHHPAAPRAADPPQGRRALPRLASALTRVGVRSGLAMEVAMSTEVNASLLRRADLQPYFEHVERMDPRYFLRAMQAAAEHGAEDHLLRRGRAHAHRRRRSRPASPRPGSRGGWPWRFPPPSCSWCEVGATPRFWSDRRK